MTFLQVSSEVVSKCLRAKVAVCVQAWVTHKPLLVFFLAWIELLLGFLLHAKLCMDLSCLEQLFLAL